MEQVTKVGRLDGMTAPPKPARPAVVVRPQPQAKPVPDGKLAAARGAVRDFLMREFHPKEIRVTKVAPSSLDGAAAWHAEAEMLVPDLSLKTLRLPLSQEILETEYCAVVLDAEMAVKSYELFDPRDR